MKKDISTTTTLLLCTLIVMGVIWYATSALPKSPANQDVKLEQQNADNMRVLLRTATDLYNNNDTLKAQYDGLMAEAKKEILSRETKIKDLEAKLEAAEQAAKDVKQDVEIEAVEPKK